MKKIIAIFFTAFLVFTPLFASAQLLKKGEEQQTKEAFEAVTGEIGLATGNEVMLGRTISQIINFALGLLGVVMLVITIYGGYLWFSAAGNDEQVSKAKSVMTQAVIGLAIIFLAALIINVVLNAGR